MYWFGCVALVVRYLLVPTSSSPSFFAKYSTALNQASWGRCYTMISIAVKCALALASLVSTASAFSAAPSCSSSLPVGSRQQSRHMMAAAGPGGRGEASSELPVSRMEVLGNIFGAVGMSSFAFAAAADAKDDPALKGTKADPEFVTCLSDCIYYCTKSKEQSRSRQECIPECRKSCAKTKAQGLIGSPRT